MPAVLIENAPGSGDTPVAGSGRAHPARARIVRRHRRSCSTPARSRRTRGSICCSPRARRSSQRGRTRGSCSPAGGPIRSPRRGAQAAAAGIGAATIFAGQRPAEEIPGVPRRRRRARLAAQPRHQHAAEDLSVPALRPADRRDAPADPHAGAGRRGGVPDRGDAGGLRRRHPRGARGSASAPARSARAPGSSPRRSTATRRTWPARARPARTSSASAAPQVAGGVA